MGTGYTRNDTVNNIADGNIINASDLDGEYDAIEAAFNASTGHTHDGSTAEGAPITVIGPAQEYVSTATEFRPKTTNTYDLGSTSLRWKDLFINGTATLNSVAISGGTITGITDLAVADGGTGASSFTANNVLLGNGSSSFQVVAPGTAGNILTSNGTTWTSAALSSTVVTTTGTQTLTNKRIDPRAVNASATTGTLTINGDTTDLFVAEGLTGAITLAQPSGTPVNGQKLLIRIKDNGTARAITWTTSAGAFRAIGITLPTTTVLGKVTYVGCVYNSADSFWDAVATVTQA
jgi:hypothetical protein